MVASATRAGAAPPAANCAPLAPTATAAATLAPALTVGHVTRSAGVAPAPPVSRETPATKVEQLHTQRRTCRVLFVVCKGIVPQLVARGPQVRRQAVMIGLRLREQFAFDSF